MENKKGKRILILGVSGLIGHKLFQILKDDFEVFGTLHKTKESYGSIPLFSGKNVIEKINVFDFEILKGLFYAIDPDEILNCVGITKRKTEINNLQEVLYVNSLFPHMLADWAGKNDKRIIHFSTDCVFNGSVGNYVETSLTDAEDIYGRTKALGEIRNKHSLTIRSSFIGQELFGKTELLEWFLSQDGKQVKGFLNTLYSGVSTIFMVRTVKKIIMETPELTGLYHLAADSPISKYELLCLAKRAFDMNIDVIPADKPYHFPTLDGSRLKQILKIEVPSWEEMMYELAADNDFYHKS